MMEAGVGPVEEEFLTGEVKEFQAATPSTFLSQLHIDDHVLWTGYSSGSFCQVNCEKKITFRCESAME